MNKKRKWFYSVIVIVICLLLVVPQILMIFADDEPFGQVMFNFYDDVANESVINNTKLDISASQTINSLLLTLKNDNLLKNYSINNKILNSIIICDGTVYSTIVNSSSKLVVTINAVMQDDAVGDVILNNGDIVEIFYTINPEKFAKTINKSSNAVSPTQTFLTAWNNDLAKVQNDAFEWLNRNVSSSTNYLMIAGMSGKAADVKAANNFLTEVESSKKYTTPTEICKDVLNVTFSGYDASSEKYHKLISKLSNYADIMKMGIFGAVNTLTAYDCNNYYVPTNATNSRGQLITNIVSYQNSNGGFPITKGGASDVDTTAMTLTVLSGYKDYPNVINAVDKGVEYLSDIQTDTGGFGFNGKDNLESLCTVIIALNSLSIDLGDERFEKGGKSLVESFLEYKNSDGGFAHIVGDKSSSMPTEQALIALASIKKSANPYKLSKLVTIDNSTKSTDDIVFYRDNAVTAVIIGSILALLAIITIVMLIITKRKKSQIKSD